MPESVISAKNSEKDAANAVSVVEINDNSLSSVESGDSLEKPQVVKGADIALQFVSENVEVLDEKTNKQMRRKCDRYVLPLICSAYGFQFLDKSALSYAAIMGVRTDIGPMHGQMYSLLSTLFFIGYLVWAFPGSWTLQKFPLAKMVCFYVFTWGMVLALHAATFSYGSIVACRIFLGVMEAPLLTGLSLICSVFYHKSEQFARTCFYFSFTGLANIIGSCMAYGIYKNQDHFVLTAWRALFLILGCATMFLAVLMVLVIPDVPSLAWWYNEREKKLAVERIRDNQQGYGSKTWKWEQVREAFLEPRAWAFFMLAICVDIPNSGITSYASILLKNTFHFDTGKALIMKAPMGVVQFCGLGMLGTLNYFNLIKHPMLLSIFGMCVTLVAGCMLSFATATQNAQLAGFYLIGFSPVTMITALSGLATNVAGRTKKVVCNGMYLVGFCIGSAVGPQTFIASEAPNYATAKICVPVFYSCCLCLLVGLTFYNIWENKRKDAMVEELKAKGEYVKQENHEFLDLTDRQNIDFRYVW